MDTPDTLDTPTLAAGARGWLGVNNRQKAGLLSPDELAVLVNGRLDDTGSVQLRPGAEQIARVGGDPVRGLFYYDISTAETLLACAGGAIYELAQATAPAMPESIPGALLSTEGPYCGAQIVDQFAIADGLRLLGLWRENGAWRTIQVSSFASGALLPPVQIVCAHAFRLFICGGRGAAAETIYASGILAPWNFSAAEGIRVGRGEGDAIVAILPGPAQRLYVLKGGSVWMVDTAGLATEWVAEAISHQRGCWAAATAVVANQDVLFLARDGVVNLGRLQNDAPISPVDLISAPIEATIRRIHWTVARRTACATLWGAYYLLAVPLDGASRNNTVLAYNTTTQRWCGEWTGWTPTTWGRSKFDGAQETLFGDHTGCLHRIDLSLTADRAGINTAPIAVEMETGAYAFDNADLLKLPHSIDAEFRGASTTVDVTLRSDGGSPQSIAQDFIATPATGAANRRLIACLRSLTGGRELAVRMVSSGGAFGLRELTLKGMPLRSRWEPPPAEMLVTTIPADDLPGTPTTITTTGGQTVTMALQEIDTITLPENSLDFVCFRGGLTVPSGSYIITYKAGSFATYQAPEVSDLPPPSGLTATGTYTTIELTWATPTDARVRGWRIYSGGTLLASVTTPAYSHALPEGGSRTFTVFSTSATGTSAMGATVTGTTAPLQVAAIPTGMSATDFRGIIEGEITYDTTGWGWETSSSSHVVDTIRAIDSFTGISDGELTTWAGGTGWASAATSYTIS